MTGERGETTLNILSNGGDEDLSVVGGDGGWSQREIDCKIEMSQLQTPTVLWITTPADCASPVEKRAAADKKHNAIRSSFFML